MKIGFFDSGLGGLTILKKAFYKINANYIYMADTKHSPYGTKTVKDVRKYTFECIENLINNGCNIIIIACNTATSAAIKELRDTYPNICFLGTEPAIKPAITSCGTKKVLVTGTSLTLNGNKLSNLIDSLDSRQKINLLPLDKLVGFADNYETIRHDLATDYLKNELSNYKLDDYSSIVLGCTHFPIFSDDFKKIIPEDVDIIDSSDGIIKNLKNQILKIDENYNFDNHTKSFKLIITSDSDLFREKVYKFIEKEPLHI